MYIYVLAAIKTFVLYIPKYYSSYIYTIRIVCNSMEQNNNTACILLSKIDSLIYKKLAYVYCD